MLSVAVVLICLFVMCNQGVGLVSRSAETDMCRCCFLQGDGATPLWVASQHGHDAIVAALLASGAAVNQGRTVSVRSYCRLSYVFHLVWLRSTVSDVCVPSVLFSSRLRLC